MPRDAATLSSGFVTHAPQSRGAVADLPRVRASSVRDLQASGYSNLSFAVALASRLNVVADAIVGSAPSPDTEETLPPEGVPLADLDASMTHALALIEAAINRIA